jgi:uncharacterized protein (DUF305 family)
MLVAASLVALGTVTGCAGSATESPGQTTSAANPESSLASDQVSGSAADVAFAQSMIPHHQQAIEMADLALAPEAGASPQVVELAEQIKAAQDPEIQQMTQWLQQWGEPTAMPGTDNADGMAGMDHSGHDMGGITMSGMMTPEQMDQLAASTGSEFDQMWLNMMIEHHEGAIEMSEQVAGVTSNPEVAELASAIIVAQQEEITTMTQMLEAAGND